MPPCQGRRQGGDMTAGAPRNEPAAAEPQHRRRRRPPAELVAIVVLTYVAGFVAIGTGIVFILLRYVVDSGTLGGSFGVTLIGAIVILFGLFIIAMASALARGKHYARVLTTIAMAAEFASGVASLVVGGSSYWWAITLMAVAVLVTVVLWAGRGGRYFAHISELDAAGRRTGR